MTAPLVRSVGIGLILVTSLIPAFAQQPPTGVAPKPFTPGSGYLSSAGFLRRATADIAPTGKLRVALNIGVATIVTKDPVTGELHGVAQELGRALAESLKVPFAPVEYPGLAALLAAMKSNAWDVAFLASSPERAGDMDMSPPFMNVNATYLVPAGSKIKSIRDVDQAGARVSVQRGGTNDIYLTGALTQAQLVRTDTTPGAFQLLRTGQVDAMAGDVPPLVLFQPNLLGSQILSGYFQQGHYVIGVPKGHPAGAAYVRWFVEQARASGLVERAIAHAGLRGVEVAR